MSWGYESTVQICGKLFLFWGSHNKNIVSWSLMDPPYLVALLSILPIPNITDMMQSKYIPSQAFLACCSLQSLPKLCLLFLSRWVLGIFCVLLKTFYWLQTLTLNRFAFHDSRGSDNGGKYQKVLFLSSLLSRYYIKVIINLWNSRNKR